MITVIVMMLQIPKMMLLRGSGRGSATASALEIGVSLAR
jgi:hypothetical protein